MYIKFWGTRGSIPTPLSAETLRQKFQQVLEGAIGLELSNPAEIERYLDKLPFIVRHTMGGNTTCLEIRSGEQLLIIDAGSGLRPLGLELMRQAFGRGQGQADMLFTHTHWDHVQGFPFFTPAFIPGNRFTIYSPFADLAERLTRQQHEHFFPVPRDYMGATIEFKEIAPESWHQIGNFRICPLRLSHPGVTYGYRF
ncbi:MAG: MBL fold metallo-hydrolase [Anaerolineae bacterium]|nr:MBL fold metallo-hydrolase [Anaerolineae bacterium]